MNFKTIVFASFWLLISCGVKTAPKAPRGSALPSITEKYHFKLEPEQNEPKEKKDDLEQKK